MYAAFSIAAIFPSATGFYLGGPLVNQQPVSGFFGLWCLVVGLFFISYALHCGFCRGPLLEHRAPPVIAGTRGCPSSHTLLSPALPLVGTAAGGVTCCVAEGHQRCDQNEIVRCLSEAGLIHR